MDSQVNSFVNKLVRDAKNQIKLDLEDISKKVLDDFEQAGTEVVNLYYSNYTPIQYVRTDNLRNNVIIPYRILNKAATKYESFIEFSPSNMSKYPLRDKETVVDNFMLGIHGSTKIKVDSPNMRSLMDDYQRRYKKRALDRYFRILGYTVE